MLNRNIYNIERIADGQAGDQMMSERVFKGITNIVFNFNFPTSTNEVVKLRIIYNGSNIALFQRSSIPSSYQTTITPSSSEYLTRNLFQIIITYDNFSMYSFLMPVQIAQTSYYKDLDGLHVKKVQFIDTNDNGDTLVIMQTDRNDVYNIILHANEQVISVAAAQDVRILAALSTDLITTSAIETNVEQNIEVVA
jgi:hypothetical protein